MASFCKKAITILAENLNSGCSYLITALPHWTGDIRIWMKNCKKCVILQIAIMSTNFISNSQDETLEFY